MSSSVYLNTLKPGDLIFAGVVINKADTCTYPGSQTSKDINDEKPIRHPCVVLRVGTDSVEVAYFTTFKESRRLPKHFKDIDLYWYPVDPAPQQGRLKPLPERENKKAQWVSLRKRHTITAQSVRKFVETLPNSSVNNIISQMRASLNVRHLERTQLS
ncbi:hypothetical protein BKA83DRAFT_4261440 [Pisolithus microcarpus]|nr:hypothetical protein BKA83DRAFT_4261440 [Pisolithus microcarpus]